MQDRDGDVTTINMKMPIIMRSLRRSNIRKRIAEYLFDLTPSGSYTADIAYRLKTTSTNVHGAIHGMGDKYRNDDSLIGLNIVEQVNLRNDIKFYRLTDFGKEIMKSIK